MDLYKIVWKNSAQKELRKAQREVIPRILEAVESLVSNPLPTGVRKISGSDYTYRIRIGEYRIVYSVISHDLIIEVIRVGHRKDIYKKLTWY
jgi:mRNA interferase RelE/StbE